MQRHHCLSEAVAVVRLLWDLAALTVQRYCGSGALGAWGREQGPPFAMLLKALAGLHAKSRVCCMTRCADS